MVVLATDQPFDDEIAGRLERAGDSVDPAEVELVVSVEGDASAERLEDPGSAVGEAFEPGDPEAEGNLARLPLSYRPRPGISPIQALVRPLSPTLPLPLS